MTRGPRRRRRAVHTAEWSPIRQPCNALRSRLGRYLISQVIADFLATHEALNLDGILFPSAQMPQDASPGQNVILFHRASAVERVDDSHEAEYVNHWESDEDRWVYYPEVWEALPKGGDNHPLRNSHMQTREPSLRLARDCMVGKRLPNTP